MIRVGYGNLDGRGSKEEIMADIAVLLHTLTKRETLTWNDIEAAIKYAKLSDAELKKNYQESIKASKKELLEAFSKLLDKTFSE